MLKQVLVRTATSKETNIITLKRCIMTSPIQLKNIDNRTPAGHYSHTCTAGGMVYIAGQLPITADGKKLIDASFEEQVQQVFQNLDACLATVGSKRDQLVQVRVYVTNIELWPIFDQLYASWLGEHRPARAVVPLAELHYGLMLEIEAVALAPKN